MKLANFAFIFMLIQWVSEIVSSHEGTEENSTSISSMSDVVFRNIEDACSMIDECKFECCQLNKLYVFARSHCGASPIDEQLSRVYWKAPFSEDHRLSCKSACSENIDQKQKITEDKDLEFFLSTDDSGRYYLCDYFVRMCYDYSTSGNHYKNLGAMDHFRRFWLPVIVLSASILFLSFTLILYLLVPELRSRIQDKCFIFHLSSRIIQFCICLVIINSEEQGRSPLCQFYGKPLFLKFNWSILLLGDSQMWTDFQWWVFQFLIFFFQFLSFLKYCLQHVSTFFFFAALEIWWLPIFSHCLRPETKFWVYNYKFSFLKYLRKLKNPKFYVISGWKH